jgi:pimeloyl-ACP methyl ester carboxylesterase
MTATVLESRNGSVTHHRTVTIDGVGIFYREAGVAEVPVVLLLHGLPTSSHMFRNLIPALADRYHVIAPDYPGYGQSDMPDRATFDYTFDHFAELVDRLLDRLNVTRFAMYVMDYGAPVAWRLPLKHPERVTGLIVQNGNAYEEGLKEFWDPIKAYWADGSRAHRQALQVLVALGDDQVSIYGRGRRRQPDLARQLGPRPGAARPAGQRRDPDGSFLRLSHQPAALSRRPGLLPRAEATDADRLGQERQDLSGRRGVSLQARPSRR